MQHIGKKRYKVLLRSVAMILVASLLMSGNGIPTAYTYDRETFLQEEGFLQYLSDSSEQFDDGIGDDSVGTVTGPVYDFALESGISGTYEEKVGTMTSDPEPVAGRDYAGQQALELNGKTYILLGSKQQLLALDSYGRNGDNTFNTAPVTGPVWKVRQTWNSESKEYETVAATLAYRGDADLQGDTELYGIAESLPADEELYTPAGVIKQERVKLGETYYCESSGSAAIHTDRVKYVGGTLTEADETITAYDFGSYTKTNSYIVFRDIDLQGSDGVPCNWTPLMFSGELLGVKAPEGSKIRNCLPCSDYTKVGRPAISNIKVEQTGEMNIDLYTGVGFFATITNEVNAADIGVSKGTVHVENIELRDIAVSNSSTKAKNTQTLVSGLTSGLGWLVGGLVDVLLGVLTFGQIKLNLRDTLSSLLNARAKDPSTFATGCFAGRVVGDVAIKNCAVTNGTVSNVKDYTGGFIGYSEGVTQYDGLSDALGGITDFLASLLNVIPGLGLGDLITILLENALPIGSLIPTGYINPQVTDCTVDGLKGTIGTGKTSFAGGFIGRQTAVRMVGCAVKNSNYTVLAKEYGGGFSGVARDADIKGLLKDLGVELIRLAQPQSLFIDCAIVDSTVMVQGTDYLGGFAGVMANSYAVNCDIMGGSLKVAASGSYAGGFTGLSTMGWLTGVGKDEAKADESLLSTVKELLTGLLGSTDADQAAKGQALFTLVGLTPSVILGCSINCNSVDISAAGDYAGGFVGKGDAVIIGNSNEANLQAIPYWKYRDDTTEYINVTERPCQMQGLASVKAGGSYAGGIIGFAGTANVAGLLNGTLGVGDFKSFLLDSVTVSGIDAGFTVEASADHAGGAVGMGIGGKIEGVTLSKLGSVTAGNNAGGFVGCTYPGDVAGSEGLKLSLLGIDILNLKNLLSVGAAIQVIITDSAVYGIAPSGFSVTATGSSGTDVTTYKAGGFVAYANSTEIERSHVYNLSKVTAPWERGTAGGYIGASQSGGLADVAGGDSDSLLKLIQADGLLSAVSYMIPKYTDCTVHYVGEASVQADLAGGFAGDFQSGKVDNSTHTDETGLAEYYAVYDIQSVIGRTYAGGFGGKIHSGAIADAGKGLSVLGSSDGSLLNLSISASQLLSVAQVYVPYIQYAGVKSGSIEDGGMRRGGFKVSATGSGSGSAGGFAGYLSGAQISYCNVDHLAHTTVTPPETLEGVDGASYFGEQSSYAVTGELYAGGFVGDMNIGSAASVGGDLKLLGQSIQLTDVASVLSVVVSTIEHSDVTGAGGGFAVCASETSDPNNPKGMAGGFAGQISGGHIQDSNSYNFSYIIGQISAGGYVGYMEPGSVANVLGDDASILGSLVNTKEALASVAEDFVPTIRNSCTTCIPCGGAVRAQAFSDTTVQRGTAGGYCGRNQGGQIWGNNDARWKDEYAEGDEDKKYTGPQRPCAAIRILSVYGAEYAGGYTGLMECADTASTGNLSLLFGLVKVENLLGALSVVYPTEENTAVYGPLAQLTMSEWNAWVEYVGVKGGFGKELADHGKVNTQEELDTILQNYIYGTHIAAGRSTYESGVLVSCGGCAGGYAGAMHSGVVTNGQAHDTKQVTAMRAAGGFVGEMCSGGAAELGTVSILGLDLNLGQTVDVLQVFVPTVKVSSVAGYRNGLTVYAFGTSDDAGRKNCGYSGGYVGSALGAQIWGDAVTEGGSYLGCNVTNLRRVGGTNAIGGYVGCASAGAVADVKTNETANGLLQKVLDRLITTPDSLVSALQATVTTIRCASVSADSDWGFVVDGEYAPGRYADYAGGFAGKIEASVIGKRNDTTITQTVNRLRGVSGGYYAGGFFGLADVGSVAEVGGENADGSATSILDLIQAGNVSVLDAFRAYVYSSFVNGTEDGICIYACNASYTGAMHTFQLSGSAGGFGGALLNGTVHDSAARDLNYILAPNYAAGFIGFMGKNGGVEVNEAKVTDDSAIGKLLTALGLNLGANAQLLNVVGSTVKNCSADGYLHGFIAEVTQKQAPIAEVVGMEDLTGSNAAGFAGFADVSQIDGCHVTGLKKVVSPQLAAGFTGRTSIAYLVDAQVNSELVNVVLKIVNALVKALYLPEAERANLVKIDLGIIEINLLADGDLLYVNLLGLKISVALSKADPEYGGTQDAAIITIGDSTIKLPCNEEGLIKDENGNYPNLELTLIKGNRTNITNCSVTGISNGYDVFGGGADDNQDGSETFGYAGGFVAFNDEGNLENNRMLLCDVVRGTPDKVGPFTGHSQLKTVYDSLSSIDHIEGNGNYFSVYRTNSEQLEGVVTAGSTIFGSKAAEDDGTGYNRYDVLHYAVVKAFGGYKDAQEQGDSYSRALQLYASPAKAVLMLDVENPDYEPGLSPEPDEGQNPCSDTIDLTIRKIWKDWGDKDKLRPDKITVTVYQSYERRDEAGTVIESAKTPYQTITMTAAEHGSVWSSSWRKVIEDVPVGVADASGNILYYYTYTVEETPVEGYITTVEYDDAGYVATITNQHDSELPSTGAMGGFAIVLFGAGLICMGYECLLRTKSKKREVKG